MDHEIIDFHTHPFTDKPSNICSHQDETEVTFDRSIAYLKGMGISKICGSVICRNTDEHAPYKSDWEMIADSNRRALELKELYGDFYIPGFHVHPGYIKESCEEIEKMSKLGVNLIGELVPYIHGWSDCSRDEFDELIHVATHYNMVINIHFSDNILDRDQMDKMVQKHPDTVFVAAHPCEYDDYVRHLNRMKMSENYYLDLSGLGLHRHRMLRRGIDECGVERFLFGSDYPTCNPAMYIGGVLLDSLISEEEKKCIFSGNAKKLLKIVE